MKAFLQTVISQPEKLSQAFILIMVIAIAYQSAQISLDMLSPLPMGSVKTVNVGGQMGSDDIPGIESLLSEHLFGEAGKAVDTPEPALDAPETQLSLVLQGVSVGKNDSRSSAIISETRGSGEIYWVGDSILGKAILSAVYEDRVVIKQGGRVETLHFTDEFESVDGVTRNAPVPSASNTQASSSDVLRSYRARRDDKTAMIRELGSALNDINKGDFQSFDALLDQYGANMQANIAEAARTAGLVDTGDGMKVSNRASETWTSRVGLQQGDVVKTVNQYPVQVLKSDRSAIDSVIKSCLARIEVQRGPNTFVVTYPFCN